MDGAIWQFMRAAGVHMVRWNGTADDGRILPAGMYVAGLEAEGRRVTRRIALLR